MQEPLRPQHIVTLYFIGNKFRVKVSVGLSHSNS